LLLEVDGGHLVSDLPRLPDGLEGLRLGDETILRRHLLKRPVRDRAGPLLDRLFLLSCLAVRLRLVAARRDERHQQGHHQDGHQPTHEVSHRRCSFPSRVVVSGAILCERIVFVRRGTTATIIRCCAVRIRLPCPSYSPARLPCRSWSRGLRCCRSGT